MLKTKKQLKLPAPKRDVLCAAFNNVRRARELLEFLKLKGTKDKSENLMNLYQGLDERLEWCICNFFGLIEIYDMQKEHDEQKNAEQVQN
ncbi:TPA: hypothetical protein ACXLHC_004974 [Klebsiella pneumoniae]